MAPAKKPINWNEVEMAMMAGCNQEKVAASQGVHIDTLRDQFRDVYGVEYSSYSNQMHRKGEALLEVAQLQKALNNDSKGNSQMLMYLGRTRLGQVEQVPELVSKVPNDILIEKDTKIMQLENALRKLEELNANKPETGTELLGSDSPL